jgi:hypothetical protein
LLELVLDQITKVASLNIKMVRNGLNIKILPVELVDQVSPEALLRPRGRRSEIDVERKRKEPRAK